MVLMRAGERGRGAAGGTARIGVEKAYRQRHRRARHIQNVSELDRNAWHVGSDAEKRTSPGGAPSMNEDAMSAVEAMGWAGKFNSNAESECKGYGLARMKQEKRKRGGNDSS